MLSLIEQIKSGKLWDFPGGIHPFENKHQSNRQPIINASIPNELVLPLKQHIGKAGDLLVKVGDRVLKGQPLTQYTSTFMLPIHAPTSGVISAIEPRTVAHPSGLSELCIVLTPDQQEEWFELQPQPDFQQLNTVGADPSGRYLRYGWRRFPNCEETAIWAFAHRNLDH